MAIEPDVPRLGCGESIDRIWATIEEPPTPHQAQCAQCRAARESLLQLRQATDAMRDADVRDPRLELRDNVTAVVMDVARSEVRRGKIIRLGDSAGGTINVSEQAICAVIRDAVRDVSGVRARRCHIEVAAEPAGSRGPSGREGARLDVNLRVVAAVGSLTPDHINSLRPKLADTLLAHFGVVDGAINITVEDLYDE